MASSSTRRLWGRDFTIVNGGLSPDQVIGFVENVRVEYENRLQEKGGSNTWDSFSKQVLAEAEREAARIRLRAQQEAEVEAARLISEGKRRAQEETDKASRRAQEITEKGVQDILTAANKKAQIAESRARQLSQLMLIRAREDIQDHITGEVQRAYHKLNGMLEDMMGSAKGIEAEWRDKTLELWSTPALGEAMDETLLLGNGQTEALETSSPPAVLEEDPAIAQQMPQERMTEPAERVDLSAPAEASSLTEDQVVGTQEVKVESAPSVDIETPSNELAVEPVPDPQEEPRVAPAPEIEQHAPEDIVIGEAATPARPEERANVSSTIVEPLLSPEEPLLAPVIEEIATPSVDGGVTLAPASQEEPGRHVPSEVDVTITVLGEETTAEKSQAKQGAQQKDEEPSPGLGGRLTPKAGNDSKDDEVKFNDMYNGEVDLILTPPVDFARVSELYTHLQALPEVRVLHTAGSWEQGTVVTVIIDKAGPLIGPLKKMPTIEAKPLLATTSSGFLKGAMGSLGDKGRKRPRINITFKESEAPQPDSDTATGQETSS
ncbi:MAG: hypothetical protein O7D33_09290 [Chloroflexi bacterium]|nr:hypothetical protein [Chloroflexota bacterium]